MTRLILSLIPCLVLKCFIGFHVQCSFCTFICVITLPHPIGRVGGPSDFVTVVTSDNLRCLTSSVSGIALVSITMGLFDIATDRLIYRWYITVLLVSNTASELIWSNNRESSRKHILLYRHSTLRCSALDRCSTQEHQKHGCILCYVWNLPENSFVSLFYYRYNNSMTCSYISLNRSH